jgi:hypothetical protein
LRGKIFPGVIANLLTKEQEDCHNNIINQQVLANITSSLGRLAKSINVNHKQQQKAGVFRLNQMENSLRDDEEISLNQKVLKNE